MLLRPLGLASGGCCHSSIWLKDNYNIFIYSTHIIALIFEFWSPERRLELMLPIYLFFPIFTVSLSVNSSPHLLPDLSATIHPPTSMERQWICASCRSQTGKAPTPRQQLCSGLPSPDNSSIYWYLRYRAHMWQTCYPSLPKTGIYGLFMTTCIWRSVAIWISRLQNLLSRLARSF